MPNQPAPIKVLVADDNEKARDALIEQLRFEDVQIVGESTLGTAAYTWAAHLDVDLVLVTVAEPLARSLQTVEAFGIGTRTWPVVALSPLGDRETMRKAMIAGARDFVVMPASPELLRGSIVDVHAAEQHRRAVAAGGAAASRLGTIITVFGVKGGIGKSTISTNLAVSLAQQTRQHVAMLDLDLQFGDAAVLLDVVPQKTIADAARDIERMDPQLITGYLTDHPSSLRLLAAPPTPDEADAILPDTIGQVIEALAATHDYVVVDMNAQFDPATMVALDLATIILVPVLPEVTCVRRTRGAMTMMVQQWGYSKDKVKLIVNRVKRRSEISLAEVEEVLAYEIYAKVPEDAAIPKAISLGTPVAMSGPKTKSGRAFLEVGRRLAGIPEPPRRFFGLLAGDPKTAPQPVMSRAAVAAAAATATPAAPSLSSWARTPGGSGRVAPPPNSTSTAPTTPPTQASTGMPAASDPYAALDHDYWNALFGPNETRNRVWANLVGPMAAAANGSQPVAPPVYPNGNGAAHAHEHASPHMNGAAPAPAATVSRPAPLPPGPAGSGRALIGQPEPAD